MKTHRRTLLGWIAGAASQLAALPLPAFAIGRSPLLQEGKKTLFQRVLTRPGAALAPQPGAAGGAPVPPFTPFYVYERKGDGKAGALLVGAGADGTAAGWITEAQTVPWRHAITLAFAAQTQRDRVLFFRDKAAATGFVNANDAGAEAKRIVKEITAKGTLGANQPVVAAEPDRHVDLQEHFYLLPVLEASSAVLKTGHKTRLVKVASIAGTATVKPKAANAGIVNFNAAVVFVIDATSSMQPYIDRTRAAMEQVLKAAEAAKVQNRIRFGIVAYQDNPTKTKGVSYLSKVFADPDKTATREQFQQAIQAVTATKSSTRAYAEDAYSAFDDALKNIAWQNYGGRYVVFITDASSREGNSALASSRLSTDQVRTLAQERGVAIYTMHLKTPEGRSDHALAEQQYKRLSTWPGRGPLYFPVEAGDPASFEADIKRMATALVEQVKSPEKVLQAMATSKSDAMQTSVDAVGRAMVLSYLGRDEGTQAPPMFEAWASDRDPGNRDIASFTVRVLLTKNQLSDLQATLRRLVEAGERAQLDPSSFYNQLRSAAVAMGRDPSRLGQGKAKNLEEAGLMAEYLEGLPYQSQLMSIDLDTWTNMGVGQSQAILDTVRSKIALYQRFHDDVSRWVKLNPLAGDGERVYPVPIDALP